MSINEGQFKISGFASKQDLLEHQVKEYQAFMREQTVRIEELKAKNVELEKRLADLKLDAVAGYAEVHAKYVDSNKKLKIAVEAIKEIQSDNDNPQHYRTWVDNFCHDILKKISEGV
jgi:chromosome segregation ATPase